jgi:hypothetical protein
MPVFFLAYLFAGLLRLPESQQPEKPILDRCVQALQQSNSSVNKDGSIRLSYVFQSGICNGINDLLLPKDPVKWNKQIPCALTKQDRNVIVRFNIDHKKNEDIKKEIIANSRPHPENKELTMSFTVPRGCNFYSNGFVLSNDENIQQGRVSRNLQNFPATHPHPFDPAPGISSPWGRSLCDRCIQDVMNGNSSIEINSHRQPSGDQETFIFKYSSYHVIVSFDKLHGCAISTVEQVSNNEGRMFLLTMQNYEQHEGMFIPKTCLFYNKVKTKEGERFRIEKLEVVNITNNVNDTEFVVNLPARSIFKIPDSNAQWGLDRATNVSPSNISQFYEDVLSHKIIFEQPVNHVSLVYVSVLVTLFLAVIAYVYLKLRHRASTT